jgi:hypothetical protein
MEAAAGGPDPDWFRRRVELEGEARRAAYDEVRANARGRPVDEVRVDLERVLRARDVRVPREALGWTARWMAGPWWPLRHPVQFLREMRTFRNGSEGDHEYEVPEDPHPRPDIGGVGGAPPQLRPRRIHGIRYLTDTTLVPN